MSYLGIVLGSVFAANALLAYGFGIRPLFLREGKKPFVALASLALANLFTVLLLWLLKALVLTPLGLEAFDVPLYLILGVPLLRYLARALEGQGDRALSPFSRLVEETAPSSLVFGIALVASRSGFGLLEGLLAALSAVLGYWAALILLDAIRERLELSDLPASFKGSPALLVSAGLMALAFMGLDAAFVKNLVG